MAFSATHAAFEGGRLLGRRPVSILLGWPLFYAVAYGILVGLVMLTLGATMLGEILQEHDRVIEDPAEVWQFMAGLGLTGVILVGGLLLISAIQLAAVFRAVLRPEDRGFAYLKLGGDELLQLVLMVIITLFFMVVVGGLSIGLVVGLKYADLGTAATVPLAITGGLIILCLAIWLSVRLSLAPAMTFAQRRLRFFGSWKLTRRRFWPLVGMYLLAFVLCIVAYVIGELIANAIVAGAGLSIHEFVSDGEFDLSNIGMPIIAAGAGAILVWLVSSAVQMALFYAPQAAAYRDIMAERNPPPAPEYDAPPPSEGPIDPLTGAALAGAAVAGATAAAVHAHAADEAETAAAEPQPAPPSEALAADAAEAHPAPATEPPSADAPAVAPHAEPVQGMETATPEGEPEPAPETGPTPEPPHESTASEPAPAAPEPPSGWGAAEPGAGEAPTPGPDDHAAVEPSAAEPALEPASPPEPVSEPAPEAPHPAAPEPEAQPHAPQDEPNPPPKEH